MSWWWSRTPINVSHLVIFTWDMYMGFSTLHHHHKIPALVNFFCAGFIVGINILFNLRQRRRQRTRITRELIRERERSWLMGVYMSEDAQARALRNLERVCKVTGAEFNQGLGCVVLKLKDAAFYIYPHEIHRKIGVRTSTTCYYIGSGTPVPFYEVMATAILLLRRDPTLFDKWREDHTGGAYL